MSIVSTLSEIIFIKAIENRDRELEFCIIKGCCPHCRSKNIKYREFLANKRFGFKCDRCDWQGHYSLKELTEFSYRYL